MSQSIKKGQNRPVVAKIVSIIFMVLAVALLVGAFVMFHEANQYAAGANAHPNAAEDQQHGLDSLGAIVNGGFGLLLLIASVAIFAVGFTIFTGTSLKLCKKAAVAKQLEVQGQVFEPNHQRETTPVQVTQSQDCRADEVSNEGKSDKG